MTRRRHAVVVRLRRYAGGVVRRLRAYGPAVLIAATAAGLAYLAAAALFGAENAIFAPVAAVVSTGLAAGERLRRAVEISTGVVLGVVAADLLTRVVGVGTLQLALAVAIAMTAAVLVRPSGLLANQAAVAAVVVMALVPYLEAGPWVRLGDAVVGGTVAVALNAVLAPDPYRVAGRVADRLLARYAAVLRRTARAVETVDVTEASGALEDLSALDGSRSELRIAIAATRERLLLGRAARRRRRRSLRPVQTLTGRVVTMLATARALARATENLVRDPLVGAMLLEDGTGGHRHLVSAIGRLADAVDVLRRWVLGRAKPADVRAVALEAAVEASAVQPRTTAATMMVGLVRSTVVDLLRATGASEQYAHEMLDTAAGPPDRDAG